MIQAETFRARRILAAHVLYLATVILHVADHIARGTSTLPWAVFWGGILLGVFQFGSLAFTVPGHPRAPLVATVLGFGSAVSTSLSHLVPHWSAISNPYSTLSLGAFSWVAMLSEIASALILGAVGLQELRRQSSVALTR